MIKATNLFNQWADSGKDHGMALNHGPSVDFMLDLIPNSIFKNPFSFMDIGCGNGWVVKKVSEYKNCIYALGIDGAEKMIKKAMLHDNKSKYLELDINNLESYNFQNNLGVEYFDIILSMEVLYYLISPEITLKYLHSKLLNQGGCCIIGVDHYLENTPSLSWKYDLNVDMCTYSISEWKDIFIKAGFINVKTLQYGANKNWKGTLVIYGEK